MFLNRFLSQNLFNHIIRIGLGKKEMICHYNPLFGFTERLVGKKYFVRLDDKHLWSFLVLTTLRTCQLIVQIHPTAIIKSIGSTISFRSVIFLIRILSISMHPMANVQLRHCGSLIWSMLCTFLFYQVLFFIFYIFIEVSCWDSSIDRSMKKFID